MGLAQPLYLIGAFNWKCVAELCVCVCVSALNF